MQSIRDCVIMRAPMLRLGSTGSLINNVNANAQILSADYLRKVAAIADVFRPLASAIFSAARFSRARLILAA